MKNQCFSKIIRDLLDDHFKGGGSNRDQHYIGIEMVPIPPQKIRGSLSQNVEQ